MDRRTLLKSVAGAGTLAITGRISAPAVAQGTAARTLRFVPQRQMVESEEVSPDGLTWTFRLRTGLKFHDGEPVLAKDVVASLTRWSARDPMGLMLKAIQEEL